MVRTRHDVYYAVSRFIKASSNSESIALIVTIAIGVALSELAIPRGSLLLGGDATSPELNPSLALGRFATAWAAYAGMGKPAAFSLPLLFPIAVTDYALAALHAPLIFINHFWPTLALAARGFSAVRLFGAAFPEERRAWVLISVGVISMVNPFTLIAHHSPYMPTLVSTAFFPAVLAAAIRFWRSGSLRNFGEFAVWAAVVSCGDVNVGVFGVELAVIVLVLAYLFWRSAPVMRLGIVALAVTYAGINVAVLLPGILSLSHSVSSIAKQVNDYSVSTLYATSYYDRWINSLRLLGTYVFFNKTGQDLFVPESVAYVNDPFIIASTFVLPLLAFSALPFAPAQKRRRVVVLVAAAFAAIAIAKGASGPGGNVFAYLIQHFKPLMAYRDPFTKVEWIAATGYAMLAGIALGEIYRRCRAPGSTLFISAVIGLICLAAYPIILGRLYWKQSFVSIPRDYYKIARVLDQQTAQGKVQQVPVSSIGFDTYRWGFVGAGFVSMMLERPVINREFDFDSPLTQELNDAMQDYQANIGSKFVPELLGLYNVRYILNDGSYWSQFYGSGLFASAMPRALNGTRTLAKSGSLTVYALSPKFVNPRAYVTGNVISGPNTLYQEALACHLVARTCRNIAFVPAEIAQKFNDAIGFRYADTSAKKPLSRTLYRIPVVETSRLKWSVGTTKITTTKTPSAWAIRGLVPRDGQVFIDFADATVTPGQAGTIVQTLAGLGPVVATVGPPGKADFIRVSHVVQDLSTWTGMSHRSWSAPATIELSQRLTGVSDLLVTFKYTMQSRMRASLYLSSVPSQESAVIPIPAMPSSGVVVRLIRMKASETGLSVRLFTVGSSKNQQASISDVALFRPVNVNHWRPLGDGEGLNPTPLYYARRARVSPAERLLTEWQAKPVDNLPTQRPVEGLWSSPEPNLPFPRPGSLTALYGFPDDVMGRRTIVSRCVLYDLHSNFDRLSPGLWYTTQFKIRQIEGRVPVRVSILSGLGQLLVTANMPPRSGWQGISLKFRAPSNSTSIVAYIYGGELSGNQHIIMITPPKLSLSEPNTETMTVDAPRRLHEAPRFSFLEGPRSSLVATGVLHGKSVLVLNEQYDDGWTISAKGLSSVTHFSVNGGVNGWLLDGEGPVKIRVAYRGSGIAIRALILGAILLSVGIVIAAIVSRKGQARV